LLSEKHTALGWGSKQTQFHGSLGKAAAASQTSTTGQGGTNQPSPDDDGRPRVSWRGDGAFFVVSSLDPQGSNPTRALRRLRFYSSNPPAHLSTSEVTPGLEGVLAWRPSGGLIASAQRFGYEGGGRHDVIFFERCGLRRGEFGIRNGVTSNGPPQTNATGPWSYKIKELLWNTDSSILALWIERATSDCGMFAAFLTLILVPITEIEFTVVQLWTTGNYHWYLKQEIIPSVESTRYTYVAWHPETAMRFICATDRACIYVQPNLMHTA
jgi:elongator complex protein 1